MNNIIELINSGGFVSYLLILCSIISLTIIINRVVFYKSKGKYSCDEFLGKVENMLDKNDIGGILLFCDNNSSIFSNITRVAMNLRQESRGKIVRYLDKEVGKNISDLERYTIVVGTIANVAIYFGLLGTIIGIIEAFSSIATSGMGGIETIIGGVSKALITTAFGLVVAIPAVVFYNYFLNKIENFVKDMDFFVEELLAVMEK